MRYLNPIIAILFFAALALMFWGCRTIPAAGKPTATPVSLAQEIARADAAGVAIDRAAVTIQGEASAIRSAPALPAAAMPHVDRVQAAAGEIRQEAARLDAGLDAAALKDSGNTAAVQRLEIAVTSMTDEIGRLREENRRLADTVFRRVTISAYALGVLALASAGAIGYWLRDGKAAALLALGGAGAITAAITANRLLSWDRWLAGGLVTVIGIAAAYGLYLVIANLRRKFGQVVETAQAFAGVTPGSSSELSKVAGMIQDPDTKSLVTAVKASLGLGDIAASKPATPVP